MSLFLPFQNRHYIQYMYITEIKMHLLVIISKCIGLRRIPMCDIVFCLFKNLICVTCVCGAGRISRGGIKGSGGRGETNDLKYRADDLQHGTGVEESLQPCTKDHQSK